MHMLDCHFLILKTRINTNHAFFRNKFISDKKWKKEKCVFFKEIYLCNICFQSLFFNWFLES